MDVTTTQRATDVRVLRRMAERNAYECYVQPDPILGMDVGHFHPPQVFLPHQAVLSTDFGLATNMETFSVQYAMLEPTTALAVALDPSTKAPLPGIAPLSIEPPWAGADADPHPGAAGGAAGGHRRGQRRRADDHGAVGRQPVEPLPARLGRGGRAQARPRAAPGAAGGGARRGREYSGLYYVTAVTHSISTDHYTQHFDGWRNALGLTGAELFIDPFAAAS